MGQKVYKCLMVDNNPEIFQSFWYRKRFPYFKQWSIGQWYTAGSHRKLKICSATVLHSFSNPIYGILWPGNYGISRYADKAWFEAETRGKVIGNKYGSMGKLGSKSLKLIKKINVPEREQIITACYSKLKKISRLKVSAKAPVDNVLDRLNENRCHEDPLHDWPKLVKKLEDRYGAGSQNWLCGKFLDEVWAEWQEGAEGL